MSTPSAVSGADAGRGAAGPGGRARRLVTQPLPVAVLLAAGVAAAGGGPRPLRWGLMAAVTGFSLSGST